MCIKTKADLSIKKIDNEIFIYDRNRALVHTFNETGTFFWEAVEKKWSFEKIVQETIKEYEVGFEEASEDIKEFFTKLKSLGIVEE